MSISFDQIPSATRVPFTYVEFNNTGAITGPLRKVYKNLIIGQKLSGGTAQILKDYTITSEAQAAQLFGEGSMLYNMIKAFRANGSSLNLVAIAVDDNAAGVAATGSVKFNGTSTGAGVLNTLVGGQKVSMLVSVGDAPATMATNFAAKINALKLEVTAVVDGTDTAKVNLTARHKGEVGNTLSIVFNYYDGEVYPDGVSAPTVVALASGAGNPDLEDLISALPEQQYEAIISPYIDAANLTAIDAELERRWGPVLQATGIVYIAKSGSFSDIETFGNSKNSKALVCFEAHATPSAPHIVAAAMTAVVMGSISIDQARPLQTLQVRGIIPAKKVDLFKMEERDLLLYDGIATHKTDEFGNTFLERVITTYKKSNTGADDPSYLDILTVYTLDYLRYDFKNRINLKYPRHKLASDGLKVVPSNTITPSVAKAEAINIYKDWIDLGLVENLEAFMAGLIVERDSTDVNRLNWLLTPDLMNQLMINGVQIKFIL